MARKLRDFGYEEEEEESSPPPKRKERIVEDAVSDIAVPEFEASDYHNGNLEFVTIIQVLSDEGLQERLWPRLNEDHFAADATRDIYRRLRTLHQLGHDWPKLKTLAMDPALTPEAKALLNTVVTKAERGLSLSEGTLQLPSGLSVPLETTKDFEGLVFTLLDSYRITRKAGEHFADVITAIADAENFDPLLGPELVERAASEVLSIRGQESISDVLLQFGYQTTAEDDEKRRDELRRQFMKDKPRFKIGIDAFDSKAGGFQAGELVLLGATTSGGKSTAALTMMVNMARMGTSSAMLQLELSLDQIDERLSANLATVNSKILRTGNVPDDIQERISTAWEDFHDECVAARSRLTIYAPSSQTISGCEMVLKQFPYKVWFIDYASLIDLDGEESKLEGWQKLGRITKRFKAIAKKYGICIVLLIQVNVDSDGNIDVRYAKAMKEDADIALAWNLTKEAKEEGVVWWQHLKARQYEAFDFPVRLALEYARFENFRDEPTRNKTRKLGKRKAHPKDGVDQVIEKGGFKRKSKPLEIEASVEVEAASDLVPRRRERKLDIDDDGEFDEFDEE